MPAAGVAVINVDDRYAAPWREMAGAHRGVQLLASIMLADVIGQGAPAWIGNGASVERRRG
jgi:hypothetical protein